MKILLLLLPFAPTVSTGAITMTYTQETQGVVLTISGTIEGFRPTATGGQLPGPSLLESAGNTPPFALSLGLSPGSPNLALDGTNLMVAAEGDLFAAPDLIAAFPSATVAGPDFFFSPVYINGNFSSISIQADRLAQVSPSGVADTVVTWAGETFASMSINPNETSVISWLPTGAVEAETITYSTGPVPEPSSALLAGLSAMLLLRRKR